MTDSHHPVLEGDGGTCVSCLHSKPGASFAYVYTIGTGGTQLEPGTSPQWVR